MLMPQSVWVLWQLLSRFCRCLFGFLLKREVLYPFSVFIFGFYGSDGLILDYAVDYYQISVFGLPFTLFVFTIFGTFRGLQNTYYPMVIALLGAVLNVIFDWVLVYGVDGWIPSMNIIV